MSREKLVEPAGRQVRRGLKILALTFVMVGFSFMSTCLANSLVKERQIILKAGEQEITMFFSQT